jgi:succinylglutamic semialdehyde dehydrogenase
MIYRSLLSEPGGQAGALSGGWKIVNPANTDQYPGQFEFRYSEIDQALQFSIEQMRSGPGFDPQLNRETLIEITAQTIAYHASLLYDWVSEETGRVEADFELELKHLQQFMSGLKRSFEGPQEYRPRGVCAVIGSSVWPVFYSLQFALVNLCAGNPVILKPSEKVTATVLRVIELLRGVHPLWKRVQVLVGDRELGRRLVCHEGVSIVIFQGTFEVGMRVKQDTLSQPSKEVLLYLGSKNPVILLDRPTAETEEKILRDAFLGAGQNCLSSSQVWVNREHLAEFMKSFHERCKAFKIGGPGTGAFMGPIVDPSVTDRYFKFIGISEREGARIVMRGKSFQAQSSGNFVTPTLVEFESLTPDQMRKSVSLQTEILAPHLSVIAYEDQDQLIETLGRLSYGHSASIYGDEGLSRSIAAQLSFARIGLNRGTYDLDPTETAQVFKRSGNHARLGLGLIEQVSRIQWIG